MSSPSLITIPILGMTCSNCSSRVERLLKKCPNVTSASVNFATEQAQVAAPATALPQLVRAIEQAGYQVDQYAWDSPVHGITCSNCTGRIERALLKTPGIIKASVNLATEHVHVKALKYVSPLQLQQVVETAGYQLPDTPSPATPDIAPPNGTTFQRKRPSQERLTVILALALAFPLLLPMLIAPFGSSWMLPPWLQFALATPVQLILGARFYRAGYKALRAGSANMDLLVALGTSASYGLSLYQWLQAPTGTTPHLYFESSATVIALVLLGKYLENQAKHQTTAAIRALEALRPSHATRLTPNQQEEKIPLDKLKQQDVLIVRPGERIPADAIIIQGCSQVDESLLSGESRPVDKQPRDTVTAGAINGEGQLRIQITALGQETVLAHIIRLVEEAQAAKAPIQRLVDRISLWFTPSILMISGATLLGWLLLGAAPETALINAVSVMVIACPCALGLATPAAIMTGTGVAARHGILIRDAQALETAHRVTHIAFDKTGTLTEGHPQLLQLHPLQGDQQQLLSLAGSLQLSCEHPLAKAVLKACRDQQLSPDPVTDGHVLPGFGVTGKVSKQTFMLGNKALVEQQGLSVQAASKEMAQWANEGLTLSWLLRSNPQPSLIGLLAFGDALKPQAAEAITRLQQQGINCHLVTGDHAGSAHQVAAVLNIKQIHAEARPEHKAMLIKQLRQQPGQVVAMVGDGINDAPALAAADIGIAMGSGTDVAMHTASITLMRSDPRLVEAALDISRQTYGKIRQNLFWAFAYNLVGVPLAVAGLLNPVVAGAAMAFSSVSVISNALLLRRWRPAFKDATTKQP